jgi:hypothetical protein
MWELSLKPVNLNEYSLSAQTLVNHLHRFLRTAPRVWPPGRLSSLYEWQIRNQPKLWNVPRPLSFGASATSTGKKFSYFGYEFDSPWTAQMRERKTESVAILNFTEGFIVVLAPAKTGNELDAMKHEAAKRGEDIRNVFGDETTRSNYSLRSKILSLTPRDLRLFSSRQEMVANSLLLMVKEIETHRFRGGLFSFQTEWFRGFQEGDPAIDDPVIVAAFDSQDQKIELFIGSAPTAKSKPSQTDINQILLSLRPASPPQKDDQLPPRPQDSHVMWQFPASQRD